MEAGKRYIVAQSYPRGDQPILTPGKVSLLLTEYDDLGLAKIHLNALKTDKLAAIINLGLDIHKEKLEEMAGKGSGYELYWNMVQDTQAIKKNLDKNYRQHIKRYIDKNTNWRISRDVTVTSNLEVVFGQLFVTLKHGSQQVKVKFSDIENS